MNKPSSEVSVIQQQSSNGQPRRRLLMGLIFIERNQ
jgi:hypothetical protein